MNTIMRAFLFFLWISFWANPASARTLIVASDAGGSFGSTDGFADSLGTALVRDGIGRFYQETLTFNNLTPERFKKIIIDLAQKKEEVDLFFMVHGGHREMDGIADDDFLALKGKHSIRFIYSTGCWNGGTWRNGQREDSDLIKAFREIGVRSWVLHAGENTSGAVFIPRYLRLLAAGMPAQNAARLAFARYLEIYDLYHPIAWTEFLDSDPYVPEHNSSVVWGGENLTLTGKQSAPIPLLDPPARPKFAPLPFTHSDKKDFLTDFLSPAIGVVPVSGKELVESILDLFLMTFQEIYPRLEFSKDSACLPESTIKSVLMGTSSEGEKAFRDLAPRQLCLSKISSSKYQILWELSPTWQRAATKKAGLRIQTPDVREFRWGTPSAAFGPYGISMETQGHLIIDFSKSNKVELKEVQGFSVLVSVPHLPHATGLAKASIDAKEFSAKIALQLGLLNLPVSVDADLSNKSVREARLLHWIKAQ